MKYKKQRNLFFLLTLCSALILTACGGGGGGGGGGGNSGNDGNDGTDDPGDDSFIAPGNPEMDGNNLIFTFSDGDVLEFTFPDDSAAIIPDLRGSGDYQISYQSGKFGGNTDSKTGDFQIRDGTSEFDLQVTWTSTTEAVFTGDLISGDPLDPTTEAVNGTILLVLP
jgi:hypothetical protein